MNKIFYYELKRAVFSWIFPAMLAVNGIYAWYVLTADIIRGAAYTAPFSVWSWCVYMGKTLPAAVVTVLLIMAGYYGKKQKQVEILTSAAPVTMAQMLLVRTAVLGICFLVICVLLAGTAVYFYIRFFGYYDFAGFVIPGILLAVPCFLPAAGLGYLLGRVHQGLVYVLAGMLVLAAVLGERVRIFDYFGAGYFAVYPLSLAPGPDGEPGFIMEPGWIAVRMVYFAAGAVLIFWSVRHAGHKAVRA